MRFGEIPLVFEVRGLETEPYVGERSGNTLHFEAGVVTGHAYFPNDSKKPAPLPEVQAARGPGRGHFENFIAAVRGRKREDLNAEILDGHYSSALCHLANISYRTGVDTTMDYPSTATEPFSDALLRALEHLKHNGVPLVDLKAQIGPTLHFDPSAETFHNAHRLPKAVSLLTREYRAPFVVPEAV
jgi:hypothetical protein